jgi:hypothetical protein
MPVTTTRHPELDLTVLAITGIVSADELQQALILFYEGSPTRNLICDFTHLGKVDASSRDLHEIIRYAKRFSHKRTGGRTALVGNTMLKYGLARMASTFAELEKLPWEMRPFKKLDEAMAWITGTAA